MRSLPVQADWYTVTEVGITITGDPTLEQIDAEISMYNTLRELSTWALADLVKYAFATYGKAETYNVVSSLSRYERTYLINIVSVSNKVAPEIRHPLPMTFSHHQAVAPIREPAVQNDWLDYASEREWSRDDLRQGIQDYGVPPINALPEPKQVVIHVEPTLEEKVTRYVRAVLRSNEELMKQYFDDLMVHVKDNL